MAAPADPRFATDATFDLDGETWEGDANKIDPGAPRVAEGFEPTTLPAEWLNWQLNLLGSWAYYIGASASRTLRLSPWRAWYGDNTTTDAPTWILQVFSTPLTEGQNLASGSNYARLILPLSDILPNGSTVQWIRASVKPGAARATPANRILLHRIRHTLTWPTLGAAVKPVTSAFVSTVETYDDGTTDAQTIEHPGNSITIDRNTYQDSVILTAGNDAGTNRDLVYGWEITYTGPKIRVED